MIDLIAEYGVKHSTKFIQGLSFEEMSDDQKNAFENSYNDFTKQMNDVKVQGAEAYYHRATLYREQKKILLACADLQKAKELGNKEAAAMIQENCK